LFSYCPLLFSVISIHIGFKYVITSAISFYYQKTSQNWIILLYYIYILPMSKHIQRGMAMLTWLLSYFALQQLKYNVTLWEAFSNIVSISKDSKYICSYFYCFQQYIMVCPIYNVYPLKVYSRSLVTFGDIWHWCFYFNEGERLLHSPVTRIEPK
jgi:hypothetical protein